MALPPNYLALMTLRVLRPEVDGTGPAPPIEIESSSNCCVYRGPAIPVVCNRIRSGSGPLLLPRPEVSTGVCPMRGRGLRVVWEGQ